jgi:glycogen operon protein
LFFVRSLSGNPYPLGATYDGAGVNFSVFSSVADRVELCLFDENGRETRHNLAEMTALCWHGYLPGLRPGQKYGYRIHGPWAPAAGVRCNASKLLLDPYAKCIDGQVEWNEAVFSHHFMGPQDFRNDIDSAPYVPRSVVIDPAFDWEGDQPLRTPWELTVIYEGHVKGLTIRHPDVPPDLRGTYLGIAHPSLINHFTTLGVTAIELMPVQQFVHDMHLIERGLNNYWGYSTIGFFAPHNLYCTNRHELGRQVRDFKLMVKALHKAGLEIILDVVYGHTAEGNHLGPVLSFKGLDNTAYYRLEEENPFYYRDYTGTGNSLNMRNPHVLQLMMDSLRYWVTEMHVDGFRFDLASTLARGVHDVDRLSAFFDVIQQDPVVSQVKLIAEPWDVSHNGYQLGYFPALWSEWNGRFRDSVRDYWRGSDCTLGEFCLRLTGSPDLYQIERRRPSASINFVTCHDGFTLADLVSYNEKHNDENCESNRDGPNDNRSWNCGTEGPTSDDAITAVRVQQARNLLATLFLSQGVPMLLCGDETGRSQAGNNNAYCQDNGISWLDWKHADYEVFAFVESLIALRRTHPAFHQRHFLHAAIQWYRNDGVRMTPDDWNTPWAKAIGMFLDGSAAEAADNDFYIAFNADHEPVEFTIPYELGDGWRVVVQTALPAVIPIPLSKGTVFSLEARSLLVAGRFPPKPDWP